MHPYFGSVFGGSDVHHSFCSFLITALRMNVRSSLYDRTSAATHTHIFGPETYNEDDDIYTRTCTTCQFVDTFEKM